MRSPSPTSLHRVAGATTVFNQPLSAAAAVMSNHPPFRGRRRPEPVAHHRPTTTNYYNPNQNHHHHNYDNSYDYNAQGYTNIAPHHNHHQNYNAVGYTYHTPHHNRPNYRDTNSDNISIYNALGYTYDTPHHTDISSYNAMVSTYHTHHNRPNYRHNNSMSFHGGGNFGPRARAVPPYNQPSGGVHWQKPADYRDWEKASNPPPRDSERFIVLSYNILADYLANGHQKLYRHIERRFMSWEWRKGKILLELELWSPDIMCLQEVDKFQELEDDLRVRGYSGFWKMRTGEPVDGCAIFFRTTRFKLVFGDSIEFKRHGMRDNVAQICVLESLTHNHYGSTLSSSSSGAPNRVVVGNIHVLYNPRRGEMKLGQVRMLLEKAQAISKTWGDAPVVLCGDFNCTPKSPLYNFISQQKLDISQVDRDKVSGQASAEIHSPARLYSPQSRGQPAVIIANSSMTSNNILEKSIRDIEKLNFQPDKSCKSSAESVEMPQVSAASPTGNLSCQPVGSLNTSSTLNCDKMDEKLHGLSVSNIDASLEENKNLVKDTEGLSGKDVSSSSLAEVVFKTDIAVHDKTLYNPSRWTAMEITTATGNTKNTILEHSLKLWSTYSEVVGSSGTRDQFGEPLVTSYNCCFMGTVDYIWRSEGLQTVRVLAPIRKDVMQTCRGFPTKKWGSDHIALVSELAFIK